MLFAWKTHGISHLHWNSMRTLNRGFRHNIYAPHTHHAFMCHIILYIRKRHMIFSWNDPATHASWKCALWIYRNGIALFHSPFFSWSEWLWVILIHCVAHRAMSWTYNGQQFSIFVVLFRYRTLLWRFPILPKQHSSATRYVVLCSFVHMLIYGYCSLSVHVCMIILWVIRALHSEISWMCVYLCRFISNSNKNPSEKMR